MYQAEFTVKFRVSAASIHRSALAAEHVREVVRDMVNFAIDAGVDADSDLEIEVLASGSTFLSLSRSNR